jgi:hypothetical protein
MRPLVFAVKTMTADGIEEHLVEVNVQADIPARMIRFVPTDSAYAGAFGPIPFDDVPVIVGRIANALPRQERRDLVHGLVTVLSEPEVEGL